MDRQLIKRHLLLLAVLAATTHSTAFARSAAEADRAVRDQGSMLGGAARGAIFGAIVGDSGRATLVATPVLAEETSQAVQLNAFQCKDVMRLSGEERAVAIAVLHGYFLGKKNATSYVPGPLAKATDQFTEHCLDNPKDVAIDAFAKFAK